MPIRWIEPGDLRLPQSRSDGADPFKLAGQFRQYGSSAAGMPAIEVTEGVDHEYMINNGVTRATRIHRYAPPGTLVPIEITETRPLWRLTKLPRVRER